MLYLLMPLTLLLAFQDWRSNSVNLWISLLSLTLLALGIENANLSIVVFGVLLTYSYLRPGSVQFIDIAFFSIGAGCFSLQFFAAYCLITAVALLALSQLKETKLPFLVAWTVGFWLTTVAHCSLLR